MAMVPQGEPEQDMAEMLDSIWGQIWETSSYLAVPIRSAAVSGHKQKAIIKEKRTIAILACKIQMTQMPWSLKLSQS